jgi:hypothetical protein
MGGGEIEGMKSDEAKEEPVGGSRAVWPAKTGSIRAKVKRPPLLSGRGTCAFSSSGSRSLSGEGAHRVKCDLLLVCFRYC